VQTETALEQDEGDDPDQDRQGDGTDQGKAGHGHACARLHAMAEIPDEVAHAPQHMVQQHPGVAEQHQDSDRRADGYRADGLDDR